MELIEAKVATGRYTSASEVVREALRLLEGADQPQVYELKRLRGTWEDGVASGDAGLPDFVELKEARGRRPATAKG